MDLKAQDPVEVKSGVLLHLKKKESKPITEAKCSD